MFYVSVAMPRCSLFFVCFCFSSEHFVLLLVCFCPFSFSFLYFVCPVGPDIWRVMMFLERACGHSSSYNEHSFFGVACIEIAGSIERQRLMLRAMFEF